MFAYAAVIFGWILFEGGEPQRLAVSVSPLDMPRGDAFMFKELGKRIKQLNSKYSETAARHQLIGQCTEYEITGAPKVSGI